MNLTSEPTCLGLSEISHAIVESLRSPLEDKIPDMMQDCGLTERLGLGQYRWNFIIAQLKNTCSHLAGLLITVFVREVLGKSLYFSTEKHVS